MDGKHVKDREVDDGNDDDSDADGNGGDIVLFSVASIRSHFFTRSFHFDTAIFV